MADDRRQRPPGLRRSFAWMLGGGMVYALCQWGLLSLLARLGTPEMVGHFGLGLAVTGPLYMFSNLELRAILATDAGHRFPFESYLGARLVTATATWVAIVVGALGWVDDPLRRGVLIWLGAAKAIEAVSDVLFGAHQREEQMDRVAKSLFLRGGSSVIAFGITLGLTGSLPGALAAMAGAWALVLVAYDLPSTWRGLGWPQLSLRVLWPLLVFGTPLGVARLLNALMPAIPRFAVDEFMDAESLGIFTALSYLVLVSGRVVHALAQSAASRWARFAHAGDRSRFGALRRRLVALVAGVGLAGVVVALLAAKPLLGILYGPAYAEHGELLVWIMLGAGVSNLRLVLEYGMTAAGWIRGQAWLLAMSLVVLVIASVVWIPMHGLLGAAYAMLASGVVHLVAVAWVHRGIDRRMVPVSVPARGN